MIATCVRCGTVVESTEEDASSPRFFCPACHWRARAESAESMVARLSVDAARNALLDALAESVRANIGRKVRRSNAPVPMTLRLDAIRDALAALVRHDDAARHASAAGHRQEIA